MNWKNIDNDPPFNTDLLFRFEMNNTGTIYSVGEIVESGDIYTKGDDIEYDWNYLCNVGSLQLANIVSVYYIDPREIVL